MKEIKYLSHIVRNIYLLYWFVFSVSLIEKSSITINILPALLSYVIGYAPVYFVNDFTDRFEDTKYKKANLYNTIINKKIFWSATAFMALLGGALTTTISSRAVDLLVVLYLLNLFYSFPPLRLRNRPLLRELAIFLIYAIKMLFLSELLYSRFDALPVVTIVMAASTGALSVSLYKRHVKRDKISEIIFGSLFLISWTLTIIIHHQTIWLFMPLLPALAYLLIKYKREQIPIGFFQTVYFIYSVVIYFFSLA